MDESLLGTGAPFLGAGGRFRGVSTHSARKPVFWALGGVSMGLIHGGPDARRDRLRWIRVGPKVDAAPKRDGIVVPEASGAGLQRWSGHAGTDRREKGPLALIQRFVRL